MEQLIINVGSAPDAGDGDTLYEAFTKVNDNFTYLFSDTNPPNTFNNSYIALNPTNADIINGVTDFGVLVNLTPSYYVTMMYDSSLSRLDPSTNSIQYGAFRVQDSNNALVGIYTNSINTYDNQNLNLLSTGTGIVTVTGTTNYEQQVFRYNSGVIDSTQLTNPYDPDALINAQALIDYVAAYEFKDNEDRIISVDDPNTYVVALGGTEKVVNVVINGVTSASFYQNETRIHRILITDNIIKSVDANTDIKLEPATGGNIDVSGRRIVNLERPAQATDAVNLQFLSEKLVPIESFIDNFAELDKNTIEDGALLVFDQTIKKFVPTRILNKQIIDAGVY
jgi:hypothetical protein